MISEQGAQAICTVFPVAVLLIVLEASRVRGKPVKGRLRAVWRLIVSWGRLAAVFSAAYAVLLAVVALSQNRSMTPLEALPVWFAGLLMFALAIDIMGALIGQTLDSELEGWPGWRDTARDRERDTTADLDEVD